MEILKMNKLIFDNALNLHQYNLHQIFEINRYEFLIFYFSNLKFKLLSYK